MKLVRTIGIPIIILTTICLCSCGSGYLSEGPLTRTGENVVFSIGASGFGPLRVGSDQSLLPGMSKDYITTDDFNGGLVFDGETLSGGIELKCKFSEPQLSAINTDLDGPADISVVDDVSNCTDIRNCCVYTVDADYVDSCVLNIDCVIDETIDFLDNSKFDLGFSVEQFMETNMRSDSGLIITAIIEEAQSGIYSTNRSTFDLDTAFINRSDCVVNTDRFVVNNDDPWAALSGTQNGPDILNHGDYLWNVDTIGAVDIVDEFSECTLYYENISGSVSLAPVANSQTVREYILIDGLGKICNSLSHTDCEGDSTIAFDFNLDMYYPPEPEHPTSIGGKNLDFAAAGISHLCGSSEGDPCNPNVAQSTCLGYLFNGSADAPDGCISVCIDYTGLFDPKETNGPLPDDPLNPGNPAPLSPMAGYVSQMIDAEDIDGNVGMVDQAICEANNGTWVDVGMGPGTEICLPNQLAACMGGGGGESCNYGTDDMITVCDSNDTTGNYPCDETVPPEAGIDARIAVFDDPGLPGEDNPTEATMAEMSYECENNGDQWLRARAIEYTDAGEVNSNAPVCGAVYDRFMDGPDNPRDLLVRIDASGNLLDVALHSEQKLLDPELLPNGFHKDLFMAGDENWPYGLKAVFGGHLVGSEDLMVFTPGKVAYNSPPESPDLADAVGLDFRILRVAPANLEQCKTDPDTNYDHDYQLWIGMYGQVDSSVPQGVNGSESCGTGGNGALNFTYEIVETDCISPGPWLYDDQAVADGGDAYSVADGGAGADKSTAEYLASIFDPSVVGENNLPDLFAECADYGGRLKLQNPQFEGTLNTSSAACVAVANRFINNADQTPENRSLKEEFSLDLVEVGGVAGVRVFFRDRNTVNTNHEFYSAGVFEPTYDQQQVFWDNSSSLFKSLFAAPSVQMGISLENLSHAERLIYSADYAQNVVGQLSLGWVSQEKTHWYRGNGTDNHYLVWVQLEEELGGGAQCATDGLYGFYFDIIGYGVDNTTIHQACSIDHRYNENDDVYQPYTAGSRDTETGGDQFVDQFFMTGDDIRAELGSAAYPAGYPHFGATDRSLRDLADACRARGSFLAATSAGDEADKVVGDSCQNAMGQLANDATEANIGATGERVGYRPLKVQLVTEINEPISPNEDFIRITPVKSDSNEIPIFTDVPKTLDGGEGPVDGWISRSAFSNAGMIQTPMTIWNRDPADDSIPYTEGDGAQNISSGVELHKVYRDSMETSETPFHYMIQIEYNLPNVGALWCNATGGQHRATYVVDGRCLVDFGL